MLPNHPTPSLYDLALTFVPEVGGKTIRVLLARFGSAEAIFKASLSELKKVNGVGEVRAAMFKQAAIMERAQKEMEFVAKHQIQLLHFSSPDYPKRLKHCEDAPALLYYKGNANLNDAKIIAVIGTRKNTDYGLRATEHLIEGLKTLENVIIISGLAAGIDTIAHRAALKNGLQTVGVLGHSLDRIYPFTNSALAKEMIAHGGLLSEFPSGTKPDRQNFPVRNRIVAGLSDVTIITESDIKGGAMITAYMAVSYNRDVAAVPGRVFDSKSQGPNSLIKRNMAASVADAQDVLQLMNWQADQTKKTVQQKIFIDLSEEEQRILNTLQDKEKLHADELLSATDFKASQLASVLLQLEMHGLVKTLPGKFYRLS